MTIITIPKLLEKPQPPAVTIVRWVILERNHTRSNFRGNNGIASNSFQNEGKS